MFLEDKKLIDEIIIIIFENLRVMVTDYAQAQYEFNEKLCGKIGDIESELYGIRLRLGELLELERESL